MFTPLTAHPFSDEFEAQYYTRFTEILQVVSNSIAVRFENGLTQLIYHPSTKQKGYQITVIYGGEPISDSQHETLESVADRLVEYNSLKILKTISK